MKREELLDRIKKLKELEEKKHEELITELYDLYVELLGEEET